MWTAIIGGITSVFGGFFGMKKEQTKNIGTAIEAISKSNASASSKEKAAAEIIVAEMNKGTGWREKFMYILMMIVLAYIFGFTTPALGLPIPEGSLIGEVFALLKLGLIGYIPARTVDKIVEKVAINKLIDKFIKK